MPAQSRIKYLLLSLIFGLATISFLRTTLDIMQSSKRLDEMKADVATLENKKTSLENSINYKKSDEYVEEQARNELNLIKPNEKVFIAPKVLGEKGERTEEPSEKVTATTEDSNPKLWFELFF